MVGGRSKTDPWVYDYVSFTDARIEGLSDQSLEHVSELD